MNFNLNTPTKKNIMRFNYIKLILLSIFLHYTNISFSQVIKNNGNELEISEESLKSVVSQKVLERMGPKAKRKAFKIISVFQKINEERRKIIELLNSKKSIDLPIGIRYGTDGAGALLYIDSVAMIAPGGILSAGAVVSFPGREQKLLFGSKNIQFNKGGFTGDARLQLLFDQEIKISKDIDLRFISKNQKTFVNWDCNGYSDMGIEAEVRFDSTLLKPVNIADTIVKAKFETSITDISDLLVDIDMDDFYVNKLPGFKFHVGKATFDNSDTRNSALNTLPSDYKSANLPEPNSPLWKGFYLSGLEVEMPEKFKFAKSTGNISFGISDAIIDNTGFTGDIYAKNIFNNIESGIRMPENIINKGNTVQKSIPFPNKESNSGNQELKGDMSGWRYSLDELGIKLQHNKITAGWFDGKIELPFTKKRRILGLYAMISQNDKYKITASLQSAYPFSLFNSDVVLLPDSRLEIEVDKKRFKPAAILNGTLTPGYAEFLVGPIKFQELKIMSDAPYIDVKAFSLGSDKLEKALQGLPVQIKEIGFDRKGSNRYGMAFDLTVNIADGFAGQGGLVLWSKKEADKLRFKVDGLEVKKIAIDVNQGAFSLKGIAQWFKNVPEYGSGFKGMVEARFEPGISLQTSALFGKVDGFRYWYADGKMSIEQGVPVFPALNAYTFGGGMFKKMMHVGTEAPTSLSYDDIDPSKLGVTSSGMKYVPNIDAGMGLKAMVDLASPDKTAVTINTIFETSFNNRGGLNYISFIGNGKFMKTMNISSLQEIQEKANAL
ncbi:MAG: hypothetical protein N4A49_06175, partial [Marinifilaceae bacterium]|nr:hypothetical protein [Marinifilaceae bacterium]